MSRENDSDDVFFDDIISVSTEYNQTKYGLGHEYFLRMRHNSDRVAQVPLVQTTTETSETDTYGALLKRAVRTALHLKERNLAKTDVVGLCSYNHLNSCVPYLAAVFLGVPVASLDPTFTVGDAEPLIKLVKPSILFIGPEVVDMITESLRRAGVDAEVVVYPGDVDIDMDKFTSFDCFLEKHPEEDVFRPIMVKDPGDTAVIFFSSGTTGLPKGICINHKAIYHQAYLISNAGILGPDSVMLLYSTLYWVSAVAYLSAQIMNGCAKLLCKSFDPNLAWHLIDKYKTTYAFLAPSQVFGMLTAGRPDGIDTSKLYSVINGGAKISPKKLLEFRALLPGTFVAQVYGCTEIAGACAYFNLTKTKDRLLIHCKPDSVGRPAAGFRVKIVDVETGATCGTNVRGELRIQSDFTMNGYYKQDSSGAFDADGWLKTGDLMYFDEDLCLFFESRLKELLKFRSNHVLPASIESVLQTHPAVKQCAVIGVPHEEDGDHPMAVICLNNGFDANEEDIKDYVAGRLNDTHKLRGGVRFIDEMPQTPSGKIKKAAIVDMLGKGLL